MVKKLMNENEWNLQLAELLIVVAIHWCTCGNLHSHFFQPA